LALNLSELGHDVSVVDHRDGVFKRLGNVFNGTTHPGQAYDIRVLRSAGIEEADAFVAVTDSDNANLMSVQIAKQVFGVQQTIARLDDPARADAYRALDIHYVAAAKLASNVIREQLLDRAFRYHVTFSTGDVEITEVILNEAADSFTVAKFEIPGELRIAAVQRSNVVHIPEPGFELREGDLVVAATTPRAHGKIRKYIEGGEAD
jgi:trk system potassium uptake protein TrkA